MKTKKILIMLSFMLVFIVNCETDTSDDAKDKNPAVTQISDIEIIGTWDDGYSGKMIIDNTKQTFSGSWGSSESEIVVYDNDEDFFITKSEAGKYSHSFWLLKEDILYTCSLAANQDTLEDAEATEEPKDYSNPDESGSCGTITGFDGKPFAQAWSKYTKLEE